MLSDIVAEQVIFRRTAAGLTRSQLAQLCAKRGYPLTYEMLANIETGRRVKDGKRRREVTVDELVMLAEVLGVAPVLLVVPVGRCSEVEILPGVQVDAWGAAEWFRGEADVPIRGGRQVADPAYRLPLKLFREHQSLLSNIRLTRARATSLKGRIDEGAASPEDVAVLRIAEETLVVAQETLRSLRDIMIGRGLTPPELKDADGVSL